MAGSFHSPRPALGLLALVLLVAPAAAEEAGEHVLQYRGFVLTEQGDDGQVAEREITVDDAHTWDHLRGESVLEVRASLVTQSGGVQNPQADFRVRWNGTALDTCAWHVQGGTVGGGRWNPSISIYCALPAFAHPGNYTIEVERTSVTGSPIVNSVTSIILHQRETVTMDINISNLELWIPILFAFGLVLLGVLAGFDFVAAGGSIALVALMFFPDGALGVEPWEFATTFALFGLLSEYIAYRRQEQIEKRQQGGAQ